MRKTALILALLLGSLAPPSMRAQEPMYDPSPPAQTEPAPKPPPPPEPPWYSYIDFSSRKTHLKIALILGSLILVRVTWRQMRGQ